MNISDRMKNDLLSTIPKNVQRRTAYNRDRGIARLRDAYKSGYITKQQVNKLGYNKFLKISNDTEVTISEGKITKDRKWDGMKGYITNTNLDAELVID